MRYILVIMTILFSVNSLMSQENFESDSCKHEIGLKISLLKFGTGNNQDNPVYYNDYLDRFSEEVDHNLPYFSYKYHFGNIAIGAKTTFFFTESKSTYNYNNDDLSIFRFSTGCQYTKFLNKVAVFYSFEAGYDFFSFYEYSYKTKVKCFNVSPIILGGYYFITEHLSVCSELNFIMQFSEFKQGNVKESDFDFNPNLLISLNAHF